MVWKIIVGVGFTVGLLMLLCSIIARFMFLYSIPTWVDVVGPIGLLLVIVFGFII